MFDTGARPQEILNIKRSNILNTVNSDILQVTIPDEVSKTFGRTFKLLLSSKILGRYIKSYKIKPDDYLFNLSQAAINMKMLRITAKVKELPSLKILNNKKKLSMYDFRHSSACYYVPRYKNRSVLMYRFGWKQEKQIEYYTQFLGLKDEITEEDLLTSDEQIGLKKELEIKDKQIQILQEQLASMQRQFKEKRLTLNRLSVRAKSEEGGS